MNSPEPSVTRIKPWVLGLTGGIASGKSTAARNFATLGVPVTDLDELGRAVLAVGSPLLAKVFERFGEQLRLADGSLDRRALRQIIFADLQQRRALEALTHPAILRLAEQRVSEQRGPYQIIVNPLLTESGERGRYSRVLVIDCPEELQLARLRARDGSGSEQAKAILAAQSPRAARVAAADDVILNDGNLEALAARVQSLHERYLNMAQNKPIPSP